jgi:hypothetical protein
LLQHATCKVEPISHCLLSRLLLFLFLLLQTYEALVPGKRRAEERAARAAFTYLYCRNIVASLSVAICAAADV